LDQGKQKLAKGSNPDYWMSKIRANMLRDRQHERELFACGWQVLRFWESDILKDPTTAAEQIASALQRDATSEHRR
jgi:DNA mismatch endonuclease (patch repair protein)